MYVSLDWFSFVNDKFLQFVFLFVIIKRMKQLLKRDNPIAYCLVPVLVFLLGRQVVYEFLGMVLQKMQAVSLEGVGILANGLADIVMIPIMAKCFLGVAGNETDSLKTIGPGDIGLVCLLGIAYCLAGNGFLQLTGLVRLFEGDYSNTMTALYGGTLWMQLFWMGIAAPVAEELVYRKILYGRIREYVGFWKAAAGASLLFGMTHGFLLQGIYSFLLGMVLCLLRERYYKLYPAIVTHMAANLCSVVCTFCVPVQNWLSDKRHFITSTLVSVFVCILIIWEFIRPDVISGGKKKE